MITFTGKAPHINYRIPPPRTEILSGNHVDVSVRVGDKEMPLANRTWTASTKIRTHNLLNDYPRVGVSTQNPLKLSLAGDLSATEYAPIDTTRLDYLRRFEREGQLVTAIVQNPQHSPSGDWQVFEDVYTGYIQNLRDDATFWLLGTPRRIRWSLDFIVKTEPPQGVRTYRPPRPQ